MKCYLLNDPSPIAKKIRALVNGSSKSNEKWGAYPGGQVHVTVEKPGRKACVIGTDLQTEGGFFKTLLLIDAVRRSGAKDVTLVLPYLAYGRAERKTRDNDAVSADMITRQFEAAGASRIVTAELHSQTTIQNSPVPLTNVEVLPLLASSLPKASLKNGFTIVSPDHGGQRRAAAVAVSLNEDVIAWVEKKRLGPGKVKTYGLKGLLKGDLMIVVDDLVDTGNTLVQATKVLRQAGASRLSLCVAHPAFTGDAARIIGRLGFEHIVVSDTLPLSSEAKKLKNVKVVSVAQALADAIR